MLLEELDLPFPLLEIEVGPDQSLGLTDPKLLGQLKSVNTDVEGFPLFALQIGDQIVFAIKNKQGDILSVIVGLIIDDFPGDKPRTTFQIQRSWTPTQFQNQGYATALYSGLTRKGYRVLSDLQLSPTAVSVWKKIKNHQQVKAWNVDTKQYTDEDPLITPRVIFVLEYRGWPTFHKTILEDIKMYTSWSNCP